MLLLQLLTTLFICAIVQSEQRIVTVCLDANTSKLIPHHGYTKHDCANPVASAKLDNKINQTGWGFLEVETFGDHPYYVQAYAAGMAEGEVSRELIHLTLLNTVDGYCDGAASFCQRLGLFMLKHFNYMLAQIKSHPHDVYWHQVNFTITQMMGLIDGYERQQQLVISPDDIVIHPIYMLQQAGDFEDLEVKLKKPMHLRKKVFGSGRCSAFVKTAPNNSELFFSHVTWTSYSSMLRLQKLYKFNLCETEYPGHTTVFSGYPGNLASDDDFVLLSSGLAVTETTISNNNKTSMKYITPFTLFTWMRSLGANRLARTGEEWAKIFAKFNSGTYNNQWTIVDYKKFKPGQKLPEKGLIHVLEQLPGLTVHRDMTKHFEQQGYWPSYNIPYFPEIFNRSDSWPNVKKFGDWFTYDKNPRALIFKRDEHKVVDINTLQQLMRYNDYRHDPLSRCKCTPPYSAENAISCRSELNEKNGTYPFPSLGFRDHGATDMKATTGQLMKRMQFRGISSPPFDHVPVFSWRTSLLKDTVKHHGHPEVWQFAPVTHAWQTALTGPDEMAPC